MLVGTPQVNKVPAGVIEPVVGVAVNARPLQTAAAVNELKLGLGSTETVKLKEVPTQLPNIVDTLDTEYTAVLTCAVLLSN